MGRRAFNREFNVEAVKLVLERGMSSKEGNDERPKRSLGGLTPAQYAKQLAARPITMPENPKSIRY